MKPEKGRKRLLDAYEVPWDDRGLCERRYGHRSRDRKLGLEEEDFLDVGINRETVVHIEHEHVRTISIAKCASEMRNPETVDWRTLLLSGARPCNYLKSFAWTKHRRRFWSILWRFSKKIKKDARGGWGTARDFCVNRVFFPVHNVRYGFWWTLGVTRMPSTE